MTTNDFQLEKDFSFKKSLNQLNSYFLLVIIEVLWHSLAEGDDPAGFYTVQHIEALLVITSACVKIHRATVLCPRF